MHWIMTQIYRRRVRHDVSVVFVFLYRRLQLYNYEAKAVTLQYNNCLAD